VPLRWNDPVVRLVLGSERRIARLAEALHATDLRWVSGYLSIKEPHSPALWWHQDWWCWDHPATYRPEAAQVAVLCYPGPTDESNAALRVLPGSHRASTELHAVLPEAHADEARGLPATHPAISDHPDQITLRLRAGDAVALDYRLLHGTHANTTARRRDGVILNFAPSWTALPDELRGHLIRHPALPGARERPPAWMEALLPHHDGSQRDLPLSREAPAAFAI
jgi:ectoine hydroxylase-related dioxygenase (phytanoyl-CoA dioxygenase family)